MAQITVDAFIKNPHQFMNYPITLVVSKDPFDLEEVMEHVKMSQATLETILPTDLLYSLQSDSLFQQKNGFYLVQNGDAISKQEVCAIQAWAASKPRKGLLVFASAHSELAKVAAQHGLYVEATAIKPWEKTARVEKWVHSYLATHEAKCEPNVAAFLCREMSCNREMMKHELDKLACYAQGKKITMHDVVQLTAAQGKKPLYELHDAYIRRDKKQVVQILKNLEREGVHPLQITRYLRNQLRQDLIGEGLHQKRIQMIAQAGEVFLKAAIIAIDTVEVELKNQSQDEALTLEKALIAL